MNPLYLVSNVIFWLHFTSETISLLHFLSHATIPSLSLFPIGSALGGGLDGWHFISSHEVWENCGIAEDTAWTRGKFSHTGFTIW
jgi:hypothetical protein